MPSVGHGLTQFAALQRRADHTGPGPGEGEFNATVVAMGRSNVSVRVGDFVPTQREAVRPVSLGVGMPANERMDWLIEKATELGVAEIWPLLTERSVLRLTGERADKKLAHWRAVAVAACEQCGRNRVPLIHPVRDLKAWLGANDAAAAPANAVTPATSAAGVSTQGPEKMAAHLQQPPMKPPMQRFVLSLRGDALPFSDCLRTDPVAQQSSTAPQTPLHLPLTPTPLVFLSGPEGGLSDAEEDAARNAGFAGLSLGPRVLRAETAALAVLARVHL